MNEPCRDHWGWRHARARRRVASTGWQRSLAGLHSPGRNHQQRLDDVAMACREGGAVVATALIDVRGSAQLEAWLVAFDTATPTDLLFANAGIMGGAPPGADLEIPEIGRALIETNVSGVLNTVYAVLLRMVERRAGRIAIVSSLAGLLSHCRTHPERNRSAAPTPGSSWARTKKRFCGCGVKSAGRSLRSTFRTSWLFSLES